MATSKVKQKKGKEACRVVITCSEPLDNGNMDIQFTYEGDAELACYLLHSAHQWMEEEQSQWIQCGG